MNSGWDDVDLDFDATCDSGLLLRLQSLSQSESSIQNCMLSLIMPHLSINSVAFAKSNGPTKPCLDANEASFSI